MKAFLSVDIDKERIPFAVPSDIVLGKAHYSWKMIADLYERGLQAIGITTRRIAAPDIYQSPEARICANIAKDDIHIAVKPIEHIRPMFETRNFFMCGWEFPEFSTTCVGGAVGNNQIAVLNRAEQVLSWSSFTADNLRRYGISTAVPLPPPVVALMDRNAEPIGNIMCARFDGASQADVKNCPASEIRNNYENVFFTVLNPWDRRKNLPGLINAFTRHAALHKDKKSALVVKLVIDNVDTKVQNISEILQSEHGVVLNCPDIYFIGENISDKQMSGLFLTFDFYVCASVAEGLNLPLIEAMSMNMVPISSAKTAMFDYITNQNAIVLPTDRSVAGPQISALGDDFSLTVFTPRFEALVKAFDKAATMSKEERAAKAANSRKTVEARYGLKRFETDFRKVVQGK